MPWERICSSMLSMMQFIFSDMLILRQVFSEVLTIVFEMKIWVSFATVNAGWGWIMLWDIRDNLVPRSSKNTSNDLFAGITNSERQKSIMI